MTHQKSDGMNYAPQGETKAVCRPGEFRFAAVGLDHGHIFGQCNGLVEAGGELALAYDPDPAKLDKFCQTYPSVKIARSAAEVAAYLPGDRIGAEGTIAGDARWRRSPLALRERAGEVE